MQLSIQQIKNLSAKIQLALGDILFVNNLAPAQHSFSEIELIRQLQNPPYQLLPCYKLDDTLALFQVHFILYHSLYQLKQNCAVHGIDLEIGLAKIKIVPRAEQQSLSQVTRQDELQTYYLDLNHLINTETETVNQMLDDFWAQVTQPQFTPTEVNQAHHILQTSPQNDQQTIKSAYKRLCHLHHPDKGGKVADLQQINWAYRVIKQQKLQ
ncbi:DnaJ domain-containing protein [Catenovulum sp. 2E275]|uniref:DNA-J related domain-containing protein n=1 Tax=Catenovulum sp. 2E275 TaxID=2980497 RepID=UPI0021CE637E|nr:DNA-J related domain-containing protein [Catenovulum sp. 2E275]MCU4675758.1 DnaJ domain-containing protein [Catenovulum sp. 2E275]